MSIQSGESLDSGGACLSKAALDASSLVDDVLYLNADELEASKLHKALNSSNQEEHASDEEYEEKASSYRSHQFQISIHAGAEDDLDLNYDGLVADKPGLSVEPELGSIANPAEEGLVEDAMSKIGEEKLIESGGVGGGEEENASGVEAATGLFSIDDGVMSDMKYLFKNTRYFLIKSNNFENVNLAKAKVGLEEVFLM
jgi:hypothetical protein